MEDAETLSRAGERLLAYFKPHETQIYLVCFSNHSALAPDDLDVVNVGRAFAGKVILDEGEDIKNKEDAEALAPRIINDVLPFLEQKYLLFLPVAEVRTQALFFLKEAVAAAFP